VIRRTGLSRIRTALAARIPRAHARTHARRYAVLRVSSAIALVRYAIRSASPAKIAIRAIENSDGGYPGSNIPRSRLAADVHGAKSAVNTVERAPRTCRYRHVRRQPREIGRAGRISYRYTAKLCGKNVIIIDPAKHSACACTHGSLETDT